MIRVPIALAILLISLSVAAQQQRTPYFTSMDSLSRLFQQKTIADSTYLNAVYTIAYEKEGFGQMGFSESLHLFRTLAFAAKQPNLDVVKYYSMRAIDADMSGLTGRCIYYKEKEVAAFKKYKPNQKVNFSMARFLVSQYQSTYQYDKSIEEYTKVLPDLQRVPLLIRQDSITAGSTESALTIVYNATIAFTNTKDTAGLERSLKISQEIFHEIKNTTQQSYLKIMPRFEWTIHEIRFWYNKHLFPEHTMKEAHSIIELLQSKEYQDSEDNLTTSQKLFEIYFQTSKFLAETGKLDSALYYLDLSQKVSLKNPAILNMSHYYNVASMIAKKKGDYKMAYTYMAKAYDRSTNDQTQALIDKDNNLYAQAEAEERQLLLAEAELKNKTAEARLRITLTIIGVLLMAGILLTLYLRQRQKARFLEFKLNMARNIHDETSPALLYALALAKTAHSTDSGIELRKHIEHTMEVIRSLSHDLKSNEQHSVSELITTTETTLKKLSTGSDFMYNLKEKIDSKQFISHYQFSELKLILQECITNTIKHASFNSIDISFTKTGNKLTIQYSDNGKGWNADQAQTGIGLKNMQERNKYLNGDLTIDNNYPQGYQITLMVALR